MFLHDAHLKLGNGSKPTNDQYQVSECNTQDLENSVWVKDKGILHTDTFSVLVAIQSSAKQPSEFAQTPVSVTAATEN